jgi:hypothetical protein
LFDITSQIVTEPKTAGEDLIIKISLINFGSSKTIDANLEYTLSDSNGAIVKKYAKIESVTTQTEFLDHINTTGLMDGTYKLNIKLTYAGQVQPASTEIIFVIGGGLLKGLLGNVAVKTGILSVMTMALLIGLYKRSGRNKLKGDTT